MSSKYFLFNPALVERRRKTIDRIDDMSAKDTTAHGRTIIVGLGEIPVNLIFPVWFSHKPIFTYGADLDDQPQQPVNTGNYPKLTATVIAWTTERRIEGAFDGYYTGCTAALTVTGYGQAQRMGFNWAFREAAIRNPILPADGTF